jgi:6,7-dimethyl-8-ribityllumazine synthase
MVKANNSPWRDAPANTDSTTGSGLRVAIVHARWNPEPVVESVLAGASLQGLLFAFTIVGLGSAGAFDSVHARWNTVIIDQLVAGAKKNLLAAGVLEENITVQTDTVRVYTVCSI